MPELAAKEIMLKASLPIHVAFALDRRFLGYTAVAAASAAIATNNLHVHVLHGDDLGDGADRLTTLIEHYGGTPHFYAVDQARLANMPVSGHVTLATYFRLSIAELLPKHVSKVIYLDGDLIVRRSLDELYGFSTGDYGIAAVPEPHAHAINRLGLLSGSPYLNAGVLLLDVDRWRQGSYTSQLCEAALAMSSRLQFWDQDLLALFFQNKWAFLPTHWNVHHRYFFGENRLPLPTDEPAIVHFSGAGLKPPDYRVLHPYADEFWSFAKLVGRFGLNPQTNAGWKLWGRQFRLWRSQLSGESHAKYEQNSRIAS